LIGLGSDEDTGNIFIETGALDGEKNLKPRTTLETTRNVFGIANNNINDWKFT
jgi:hypothetical protein